MFLQILHSIGYYYFNGGTGRNSGTGKMCQDIKKTRDIVAGQLELLRDDFRKLTEEELFRIYLNYMVEWYPERFNRVVEKELVS